MSTYCDALAPIMATLQKAQDEMCAKCNNKWQPIATAPKYGEHFLAYFPNGDRWIAYYYHNALYVFSVEGEFRWDAGEATHWMPLPKPPEGV